MVSMSSREQAAIAILRAISGSLGLGVGEPAKWRDIHKHFHFAGDATFEDGILFAVESGWLLSDLDVFRITAAGKAVALRLEK